MKMRKETMLTGRDSCALFSECQATIQNKRRIMPIEKREECAFLSFWGDIFF